MVVAVGTQEETAEKTHDVLLKKYETFLKGTTNQNPRDGEGEKGLSFERRTQFGGPRLTKNISRTPFTSRRPKPIFMHVHKVHKSENKAIPVAIFMPGRWLKGDEQIPFDGSDAKGFVESIEGA